MISHHVYRPDRRSAPGETDQSMITLIWYGSCPCHSYSCDCSSAVSSQQCLYDTNLASLARSVIGVVRNDRLYITPVHIVSAARGARPTSPGPNCTHTLHVSGVYVCFEQSPII